MQLFGLQHLSKKNEKMNKQIEDKDNNTKETKKKTKKPSSSAWLFKCPLIVTLYATTQSSEVTE